jgi:hypothetical protein
MNNPFITGNDIFVQPEMHVNTEFILIQYMQLFETFFTLASNTDTMLVQTLSRRCSFLEKL